MTLELRPFQRKGVEWLRSRRAALLGDEMGCLSGDTGIKILRNGVVSEMKLSHLYAGFNGLKYLKKSSRGTLFEMQTRWDLSEPSLCKSLGADGIFKMNRIVRVVKSGHKSVVKLTLKSGKTIRLTPDHEVLREDKSWSQCGDLMAGEKVLTNGVATCKMCGSRKDIVVYAYAKFRGFCRKCVNRKLKFHHNYKGGKFIDGDGYVRVSGNQEHPRSNPTGAVYEHILVMEKHLGRFVSVDEHIHHRDEVRHHNKIENLELLTPAQHLAKHKAFLRMDGGRAGTGGEIVFTPRVDTVVSVVEDGEADVYDIVMSDPNRNFVANGIVVHNCGKTVQVLSALHDSAPTLVVCPASIKGVWKMEAARWRPEFETTILSGRGSFRWPKPKEIVVCNYDILPEGLSSPAPTGLIVVGDEATAVKSNKTARHKRFEKICTSALRNKGSCWLLTATPMLNNSYEIWNILKTVDLNQEAFGHFGKFLYLFNGVQGRFGIVYGRPRPEARACLNKVMLRRTQSEVAPEIPAVTIKTLPVDIPDNVRKVCDRAYAILRAHGIDLESILEDVSETQLTGAEFEEVSRARKDLATAKIPALLELVESYEEAGEPLVVFSAHRAPIDLLAARDGWDSVTGGDSADERARAVQRFQDGQLKGIALTIQAGGMGLTLTRACHAVFLDRSWTPDMNKQAIFRLKRIGQTRKIIITNLIGNHAIDERVGHVNDIKADMIESVIDSGAVSVPTDAFEETK